MRINFTKRATSYKDWLRKQVKRASYSNVRWVLCSLLFIAAVIITLLIIFVRTEHFEKVTCSSCSGTSTGIGKITKPNPSNVPYYEDARYPLA